MLDHDNREEFADAELYDSQDDSDTGLAFYSALAQETGSPVLEIGCGTGRIAIPLARQGFEVTGLDVVPAMIAQARRKAVGLSTRWVVADGRSFDLGDSYRLIFLTGNAFQLFLTRADQETLLRKVRMHLHPDGLFAFETRNPRWRTAAQPAPELPGSFVTADGLFAYLETQEQAVAWDDYSDAAGHQVHESTTQRYDHVSQILHWTTDRRWQENGEECSRISRIAVRYTFPQELEALLHYNGFTIIRQYGNWNYEPLGEGSPSIIVVCRATH